MAYIVNGKRVTWADIHKRRAERDQRNIQRKREPDVPLKRAGYVWVFWQPHWIYHGWHLYLWTLKDEVWLSRGSRLEGPSRFIRHLMEQFPCGVIPIRENLDQWMKAFAKTYARSGRFKKQGLLLGWVEYDSYGPVKFSQVDRQRGVYEVQP